MRRVIIVLADGLRPDAIFTRVPGAAGAAV